MTSYAEQGTQEATCKDHGVIKNIESLPTSGPLHFPDPAARKQSIYLGPALISESPTGLGVSPARVPTIYNHGPALSSITFQGPRPK